MGRTVALSALKALSSLVSPAKWLHRLYVDQTRIEISVAHAEGWSEETIPVQDRGGGVGLLLFVLTTSSKHPVEVTQIEVDYAAPLQLLDPGNRGFFVGGGTLEVEFPFRMSWEGSAIVRAGLLQAFALAVKFPDTVCVHRLRMAVHARRQHTELGGFLAQGRIRVTLKEYRARLVSGPVSGLAVPPRTAFTSIQPFLIESEATLSGIHMSATIHERMSDGTVSTTHVRQPEA